jgi:Fe-S oxidoreductase
VFVEDCLETIDKWKNCPMANYVCPVAKYTKLETNTPRGLAFVLSLIINNKKNYDKEVIDRIYQCDLCRACEATRRDNSSIPDSIIAARRDIIKMKREPEQVKDLRNDIIKNSRLFDKKWIDKKILDLNSKSDLLLIGYDSVNFKKSVNNIDYLFKKLKINYSILDIGKYPSPISMLDELGYIEDSRNAFRNLSYLINNLNVKEIVFVVSYDLEFIKKEKIDLKTPVILTHSFIYIKRLVDNVNLSLKKSAVYFDLICNRESKEFYDIPREILKSIKNLDIKEMMWNRNESTSCGGLSLCYTFPELAEGIIGNIIKEVDDYNIDTIITSCNHCVDNFRLSDSFNKKFKVMDLWEVVCLSAK